MHPTFYIYPTASRKPCIPVTVAYEACRVISSNFKFGGGYRKMLGGINKLEERIYIEKHLKAYKNRKSWAGGVLFLNWGVFTHPRGSYQYHCL